MDTDVAIAYLGGKKFLFLALLEQGWLDPLTEGHRYLTFRRPDIDAALTIAKQSTLDLRPSAGIDSVGKAIEVAKGIRPAA